jgi:D-beta-D-heptose 7-phosphate kinase / D-beta-D-heptose 1-phosphate adenosyltransferase
VTRLVVVGDALLDRDLEGVVERLSPEAPVPVVEEIAARTRPGGAALAAALAAADCDEAVLVTALGRDPAGRELARLLGSGGVEVVDVGLRGATPEKVRVRAGQHMLLRLDHGDRRPAPCGPVDGRVRAALRRADAVLVSDYGRGLAADAELRAALSDVEAPVVWDPHPRGADPVAGARLATPNRGEAARLVAAEEDGLRAETARATELLRRWQAEAVAITLGPRGALLVERQGAPVHVPASAVSSGDPCGAGDRFAETAARALARGALVADAVEAAVAAASAFVAAGGAAAFAGRLPARGDVPPIGRSEDAGSFVARVRSTGGTVVATGGCFDLLHAGHVAMLEAARSLGDCLVVLLNSDDSMRRLKGADRPLVPEDDRAAVLRALAAVDAVVVFDEDTPEAALARLRPDVFAKGGDYTHDALPETPLVESWGGQVVILPYVAGRSTTRLIEEARAAEGSESLTGSRARD